VSAFLRGFAVGRLPNLSFLAKAPNACFFDNLGYPLLRSELGVEVEKFETIALMIIASVSVLLVAAKPKQRLLRTTTTRLVLSPSPCRGMPFQQTCSQDTLVEASPCPSRLNMRDLRLCRADTRCRFVRSANGTWSH